MNEMLLDRYDETGVDGYYLDDKTDKVRRKGGDGE
jgi:hypothetical protein